MVAQQAQATGTLGATPIANLLVYALDRKLSGTLVIEDHRARKSAIAFRAGAPVKVKIPDSVALLSEVLVKMGALDAEGAAATFESARGRQSLHGALLVADGFVEEAALASALAEQVALKIEWLCGLRAESVYGYYDAQDFLQAYGGPEGAVTEPLSVIWRTLRLQTDAAVVEATLARIGTREVRLHPNSRVGRMGFTDRERGVLDVLRAKPQPLATLFASELLPEPQMKKILYALVVTRHLDLGSAAAPVGVDIAPSQSALPPPRGPSDQAVPSQRVAAPASLRAATPETAEQASFRKEIRERAESAGRQTHYEVLGVDIAAVPQTIQAAFFQLAKRWHPDRIAPQLADVRDLASRVFGRMSEAHQILSNDEQRRQYDRVMSEGATPDEHEVVQRVLLAAAAFQKAEVLVRRGNLEEAEKQAAVAAENDPDQAEYLAFHADLLSQRPERQQSGVYADLVKIVLAARKSEPENLKVRIYTARVLKRAGELEAAHREFRAVAEKDAHNVEAAREVRLFGMRRGKHTTDPRKASPDKRTDPRRTQPGATKKGAEKATGGTDIGQLFGKLFKR
jgi:curved DNA-binding protein CbpA